MIELETAAWMLGSVCGALALIGGGVFGWHRIQVAISAGPRRKMQIDQDIAALRSEIAATNNRVSATEAWQASHSERCSTEHGEMNESIARLSGEIQRLGGMIEGLMHTLAPADKMNKMKG